MTSQNRRPQATTSKGSIYDSLSPEKRTAFEKAVQVVGSQKAADAKAFNDRQLKLALEAPVLNTARKDGGVDGYARELAINLLNEWAVAVKTETTTRFASAKMAVTDALFDETKAAALAAGSSEEEALIKAGNKVAAVKGVLYNAMNAARKAVDHAFEEIKKEKASANAS